MTTVSLSCVLFITYLVPCISEHEATRPIPLHDNKKKDPIKQQQLQYTVEDQDNLGVMYCTCFWSGHP